MTFLSSLPAVLPFSLSFVSAFCMFFLSLSANCLWSFSFPLSLYSVRYLSHPSVWSLFLLGQLIDLSPYLVSWLISLPPWPADWSLFLLGQLTDLLPSSADWSLFLLGQLTDLSPYLVSWLISHPTWSADWSLYFLGQLTDLSISLVSWPRK